MADLVEMTITLTDAPDDKERAVITDGLRTIMRRRQQARMRARLSSSSAIPEQRKSSAACWAARTLAS